ncbi:hypothetical protein BG006_009656 [Podila minutissima]|uniref:SAP domain-containing protein n=1 Tax=Podila minutissima TaxID=64525 RepID=A0A9P5SIC4_9FUNG|nr:hypothetical protein BG006_009656 [Podila minutissima]
MLRQTATFSTALHGLARTYSLSTTSSRVSLTASRTYASTSIPRRSQAQAIEESHHRDDPHHQQQHQATSSGSSGTSGSPGTGAGSGVRVPYYTLAELEAMTLLDLRALCKENGLKVGGRKKELVDRTFKYVHHHQQQQQQQHPRPSSKEAVKTGVANTGTERTAHIKDQLEREARLQKEQAAQMKLLEKEAQAREKREIEKRKEQQEKDARLAKEKHEHELRLKEQHEKELRLKKEQQEKDARLAKEKHEHELRLKKQHEKEARLAKEKHENDLRLKEAHEKEALMKKEQQEKEALIKKELHEKQQFLLKEEEKLKEQLAEAAKRVQAQAVGHEHQNAVKSATKDHTSGSASKEGSSRHQSNQDEWAKEKLPLGTRAAGLAMGLGIMAWFMSGKRDRWAEAQDGEKPKE